MSIKNLLKNPFFIVGVILGIIFIVWLATRGEGDVAGEQAEQSAPPSVAEMLQPLPDDHLRGTTDAPVMLIVYSDFECPFCANYAATLTKAREEFGESIAVVFRHYPLDFHAYAFDAALASECAAAQGKFWEMHNALFGRTAAGGLNKDSLIASAQALGLDGATFSQCMSEGTYSSGIVEEIGHAERLGVSATPTTFINGKIHVGAIPWEDYTAEDGEEQGLQSLIAAELEN